MIVAAAAVVVAQLLAPDASDAQGRGGGARGGGGGAPHGGNGGGARVVAVAPAYYSPLFYDPWFFDGWYGAPFGYGYPVAADAFAPTSSLRVQVEPRQTEVFVDGYYAGPADEFDGTFQRLRVAAGEHDIELYLQGYKSVHQKILLQPDATFRLRHTMLPLAAGEAQEPRPVPPPPPPGGDPGAVYERQPGAPAGPPGRAARVGGESSFGTIAVRVQPADAEVLVDGERWDASGTGNRLTIQLPDGAHRVEVRKSGFAAFSTTVQVRRGETATLNVTLTRE